MKAGLRQSEIFLHPGELCFSRAPGCLGTLLGSCVSVTLWHPGLRFGGMCHILLPARQNRPPGALPDGRYADEAIERFYYEIKAQRITPKECQIKLFGGGNMFAGTTVTLPNIGERNIDATRTALSYYGFSIQAEHVGGTARRRLFLDLGNGDVWLTVPGTDSLLLKP
ncbi:MAG: chemotaxis protein CheD [Corticimicrobacter sp.]|uniref:chemotaxis protein CheD n=1 Tax=Corticimicrobacter sp. TaxID=2678536 RepID=UPI0032DBB727